MAADLEINAAIDGIELDVLDHPRQLQTQCACERRFNSIAHQSFLCQTSAPWACGQANTRPPHMPTGLHYRASF